MTVDERRADAPALEARGLSCGYGSRAVVSDVSFRLDAGQVLALLGPNGVGKTTLFKTLLGFLQPLAGAVRVRGRDTAAWSRREFAREVAYIPQMHVPSFAFSVHDVVLMGRTPHLSGLSAPSARDDELADAAIERMGIGHLARRDYASLSGGERQMVLIARALAQQPRVMVMDEPCASLDFGNQARLLEQMLDLAEQGMALVMTTHDPNHAFLLDGEVLCLGRGGALSHGSAREMLTAPAMSGLYGVPVAVGRVGSAGEGAGEGGGGASSLACVPLMTRKG
ncbi:ABC transporter ATP-binding protein [Rubneribacter sp.]